MKKIACILMLFMVVSASAPALAEESAPPQIDYSAAQEAAELFSALGFELPETFSFEEEMTRANFLYLLMQLLGFPKGGSVHGFSDVTEDLELSGVLGYAQSLEIVAEAAEFRPFDSVTYAEACKMCVVAAGYALEAERSGGFPSGYLAEAAALGLRGGLKNPSAENLSSGDALILLKNLGDTGIRIQTASGESFVYETYKGRTVFSEYHKLYKISGIIEMDQYTALYDETAQAPKGMVRIDGILYTYTGDYMLGQSIKGYARETDDGQTLVWRKPWKNQAVTIPAENILSVSQTSLKYQEEGKEKRASLLPATAFLYNGRAYSRYRAEDFKIENGQVTLLDNNDDGTYEVALVEESDTLLVKKIDRQKKILYGANGEKPIDLSGQDIEYTVSGAASAFGEIMAEQVVNCFQSKDGKLLRLAVTAEIVSGKVAAVSYNEKSLRLGEQEYFYNFYFEKNYLAGLTVGQEIDVALDRDGKLTALADKTSRMEYGLLIKAAMDDNVSNSASVKILTKANQQVILQLADKVLLDNKQVSPPLVIQKLDGQQLIRYRLNAEEKIAAVDTASAQTGLITEKEEENDRLKRFEPAAKSFVYRGSGLFGGIFASTGETVFFNVVNDESLSDEKRFSAVNPFVSATTYQADSVLVYDVGQEYCAGAIVYINTSSAESLGSDTASRGIVDEVYRTIDEEDQPIVRISIYEQGSFREYDIIDEDVLSQIKKAEDRDEFPLQPGDYVRFQSDNGVIRVMSKDFEAKTGTLLNFKTGTDTNLRYYYGKAYAMKDAFCVVAIKSDAAEPDLLDETKRSVVNIGSNYIAVFDTKTKRIIPGTLEDLVTYMESPADCSTVLINTRQTYYRDMVIYK